MTNLAGKEKIKEEELIQKNLLKKKIACVEPLYNQVVGKTAHEKISILNSLPDVNRYLSNRKVLSLLLTSLPLEQQICAKSIIAIGQADLLLKNEGKVKKIIKSLVPVESFYESIGGLIGYYLKFLKLLKEKEEGTKSLSKEVSYARPEGFDLELSNEKVRKEIILGIENLPQLAEVWAVGGAGDRLDLKDAKTGKPLPAAKLVFGGYTLLEGLIRDLQAREYLYYKLYDKQITVPVAMMTSEAKKNHQKVEEICESICWGKRPKSSFFLFSQPLVPMITEEGDFALNKEFSLEMKPGGHGVIWKLAKDKGVFDWFFGRDKKKALVRQINNPVAGTDHALISFAGIGTKFDKTFGFISCNRMINASEGMIVLKELKKQERFCYTITNIEYTEFAKKGLLDVPAEPGSQYSAFPANTNILFIDLESIANLSKENPFPGLTLNMKNESVNLKGKTVKAGRLESTMQNIADAIEDCFDQKIEKKGQRQLKTFVAYNKRRKTLSTTKKSYYPDHPILETPVGCFYDMQQNSRDLFSSFCNVKMPKMSSYEECVLEGPPFVIFYHPCLGPIYSIIAQKIRGGEIREGSFLQLEISEIDWENVSLSGALTIKAKAVYGHENNDGNIVYSENNGKCELRNVKILNRGINFSSNNKFWKNEIDFDESLSITIEGDGEFCAQNVTLSGNLHFKVPKGVRMIVYEENGEVKVKEEKISNPTWYWKYSKSYENQIHLEKKKTEN